MCLKFLFLIKNLFSVLKKILSEKTIPLGWTMFLLMVTFYVDNNCVIWEDSLSLWEFQELGFMRRNNVEFQVKKTSDNRCFMIVKLEWTCSKRVIKVFHFMCETSQEKLIIDEKLKTKPSKSFPVKVKGSLCHHRSARRCDGTALICSGCFFYRNWIINNLPPSVGILRNLVSIDSTKFGIYDYNKFCPSLR